jgi:hypothetical protein
MMGEQLEVWKMSLQARGMSSGEREEIRMKIGTRCFYSNGVGRTRENGQRNNGPITPLLMCNGPLADEAEN